MRILIGNPPLEFNTFHVVRGPAAHPRVVVQPTRGKIIGGGAAIDTPGPNILNLLTGSFPDPETNTWKASAKDHITPGQARLHAWCVTVVEPAPFAVYVARAANAEHTGMTQAIATLPQEYALVGGGARAYLDEAPDAGALLVNSSPVQREEGDGWRASATDHRRQSPVCVEAFAIGLRKDILTANRIELSLRRHTGIGPTSRPTAEVRVQALISKAAGQIVVTGGGLADPENSNFLTETRPFPDFVSQPEGWRVASSDHTVPAPTRRTCVAIYITRKINP